MFCSHFPCRISKKCDSNADLPKINSFFSTFSSNKRLPRAFLRVAQSSGRTTAALASCSSKNRVSTNFFFLELYAHLNIAGSCTRGVLFSSRLHQLIALRVFSSNPNVSSSSSTTQHQRSDEECCFHLSGTVDCHMMQMRILLTASTQARSPSHGSGYRLRERLPATVTSRQQTENRPRRRTGNGPRTGSFHPNFQLFHWVQLHAWRRPGIHDLDGSKSS